MNCGTLHIIHTQVARSKGWLMKITWSSIMKMIGWSETGVALQRQLEGGQQALVSIIQLLQQPPRSRPTVLHQDVHTKKKNWLFRWKSLELKSDSCWVISSLLFGHEGRDFVFLSIKGFTFDTGNCLEVKIFATATSSSPCCCILLTPATFRARWWWCRLGDFLTYRLWHYSEILQ